MDFSARRRTLAGAPLPPGVRDEFDVDPVDSCEVHAPALPSGNTPVAGGLLRAVYPAGRG